MDLRALSMGLAFAVMWASAFTSTRCVPALSRPSQTPLPTLTALIQTLAPGGVAGSP